MRMSPRPVYIDARRGSATIEPLGAEKAAERIGRVSAEKAGLGKLLEAVVECLSALIRDHIVLVDESHLVGGDPATELESLCKTLTFYPRVPRVEASRHRRRRLGGRV